MITLRNITKSFGSLQVLKGIDLQIEKGEVVSIVGPSGAGKTTLLQIMGTLDTPDTGSVLIGDTDVTQLSQKEMARFRNQNLGFVFQFHQLLPEFTALENVMIPALIANRSQKETKERAKELLDFLGLSDRAEHKPNELSGGEKQRVAIATALVSGREILVFDEPTSGLDLGHMQEVSQEIRMLSNMGKTVLVITHDYELIVSCCSHVLHLENGAVEEQYQLDSAGIKRLQAFFMEEA